MPELGMRAEHCTCEVVCVKGVEPMADCICKLPGDTITAYCDVCDPTHQRFTWHNNGSCVACVRRARQEAKDRMAKRHAEILQAPPQAVNLDEIDYGHEAPEPQPFGHPWTPIPTPSQRRTEVSMQIILRVAGQDVVLADKLSDVVELIRHAPRH